MCVVCFPGFTSLCETYGNRGATDASCGTEKLTATLNTYIGKIVEGKVLKYAYFVFVVLLHSL